MDAALRIFGQDPRGRRATKPLVLQQRHPLRRVGAAKVKGRRKNRHSRARQGLESCTARDASPQIAPPPRHGADGSFTGACWSLCQWHEARAQHLDGCMQASESGPFSLSPGPNVSQEPRSPAGLWVDREGWETWCVAPGSAN